MDFDSMSMDQLIELAQTNNLDAQFLLGSRYYTNKDFPKALIWYKRAANSGHARAQLNLGYAYQIGEGVEIDIEISKKWYERAAQQGLANAQNNLANIFEQSGNFEKAFYWYKLAADQGFVHAEASLGFAYSQGRGVKVNAEAAFKYYQIAAEKGIPEAQSNLALMFAQGRGTNVDASSALHWLKSSADQGYATAEYLLGDFYVQGFGVNVDVLEAVRWFKKASVRGDVRAQNTLASYYADRNGEVFDPLLAYMWFAVVAKHAYPGAELALKNILPNQSSKIHELISLAVDGDVESQRELAFKLKNGDEISQDDAAAQYWVQSAAQLGDSWSQTTLALLLGKSSVKNDNEAAIFWLDKAVRQGDDRARFNLGLRQILGEGTDFDLVSASVNLIQASLSGFEEARKAFENIQDQIDGHMWQTIIDRVKWSDLSFILGPLADGHLEEIRKSQDSDDGTEEAEWFKYTKESANLLFLNNDNFKESILNQAFGESVTVNQIYVGRAYIDKKVCAAITINLKNIHLKNGLPVYWKPPEEPLHLVTSLIGLIDARSWIRSNYMSF